MARSSPNDKPIVIYDIQFDGDMCTTLNDQFTVIRGLFFVKRRPGVVFTILYVGSVTILSGSESVKVPPLPCPKYQFGHWLFSFKRR